MVSFDSFEYLGKVFFSNVSDGFYQCIPHQKKIGYNLGSFSILTPTMFRRVNFKDSSMKHRCVSNLHIENINEL